MNSNDVGEQRKDYDTQAYVICLLGTKFVCLFNLAKISM